MGLVISISSCFFHRNFSGPVNISSYLVAFHFGMRPLALGYAVVTALRDAEILRDILEARDDLARAFIWSVSLFSWTFLRVILSKRIFIWLANDWRRWKEGLILIKNEIILRTYIGNIDIVLCLHGLLQHCLQRGWNLGVFVFIRRT